MPVSYVIDSARRVIFIRCWGVFTTLELLEGTRRLLADARFDQTFGRLLDIRAVTAFEIESHSIASTAAAVSRSSTARRATVYSGTLGYGLARMSQLNADSPSDLSQLFSDLAPAMEWLGLVPTASWPPGPVDYCLDTSTPGPPECKTSE